MNDAPAVASTELSELLRWQVRLHSLSITTYWVLMASVVPTAVNLYHNHFEVDASYVVVAALGELAKRGEIDKKVVADAIAKFNIDADKVNPRLA
ncbi:hypothetical protein ACNKHR_07400 [Shigella flexneri]